MFCPFTQNECNERCALRDAPDCAIFKIMESLENMAYELGRGSDLQLTEEERKTLGEAFREAMRDEQQSEGEHRGA